MTERVLCNLQALVEPTSSKHLRDPLSFHFGSEICSSMTFNPLNQWQLKSVDLLHMKQICIAKIIPSSDFFTVVIVL